MPLTLNFGITRKLGQPGYSSLGASCHLAIELDASLIDDPESLQIRIRRTYTACAAAVQEELDRLTRLEPAPPPESTAHALDPNGRTRPGDPSPNRPIPGRRRPDRPATPAQVQAIRAIARDHGADLAGLLHDEYGVERPDELTSAQASKLIDTLKAVANV
ncbi:hypothetical protein BH23PLA1_BH23PLA1_26180 [soil metagenome]